MNAELIKQLREEAERLSAHSLDRGVQDAGIAANLAEKAADALETAAVANKREHYMRGYSDGFKDFRETRLDAQIKYMVDRFLQWRLPANFNPDAGISFTPEYNVEWNAKQGKPPQRHEPVGTNLFDAVQAEAMVRFMIDGLAEAKPPMELAFDNDWLKAKILEDDEGFVGAGSPSSDPA